MARRFILKDIVVSYEWLGHSKHGYTELCAFHRDYKPGKENFAANLANKSLPKTWYTKNASAAVKFAKEYFRDHTCCFSINPRTYVCKTKNGYTRRARESDIELVTNIYFDIDPVSEPTDEQIAELELFLLGTEQYFPDLGIMKPVKAFTGRGYHLLFAIPPIKVKDSPDIKDRLNQFRQGFCQEFCKDLSGLELKLDNTQDLCRLAKIYGTRKPGGRRVSRFYGSERVEDQALKDCLLNMSIEVREDVPVKISRSLPENFVKLLRHDPETKQLWEGTGKTDGDTSNSGYDFSLTKRCLRQGITDVKDIAAILALRPRGAVQMSGKGQKYIKLTIANAIK